MQYAQDAMRIDFCEDTCRFRSPGKGACFRSSCLGGISKLEYGSMLSALKQELVTKTFHVRYFLTTTLINFAEKRVTALSNQPERQHKAT